MHELLIVPPNIIPGLRMPVDLQITQNANSNLYMLFFGPTRVDFVIPEHLATQSFLFSQALFKTQINLLIGKALFEGVLGPN